MFPQLMPNIPSIGLAYIRDMSEIRMRCQIKLLLLLQLCKVLYVSLTDHFRRLLHSSGEVRHVG
jgi:hypothetical protein